MCLTDSINHLIRSWEQRCGYPGSICGEPLCLMSWTLINLMGQISLGKFFFTSKNAAGLDWKGQRWDKTKEKLLQGQSHGCKGQSFEPQRIILKSWDLMEFSLLSFGLAWNVWSIWFLFIPLGMGVLILCLSYHYILEEIARFLISQFHRWKKILPQDGLYPESIHDWFSYLDKNLDLSKLKTLANKGFIKKVKRQHTK